MGGEGSRGGRGVRGGVCKQCWWGNRLEVAEPLGGEQWGGEQ